MICVIDIKKLTSHKSIFLFKDAPTITVEKNFFNLSG